MESITLKELLSVVQTLPQRKLPSSVFKGEVIRGKEHAPVKVDNAQQMRMGQIPVHFFQCNCNDERSDWVPRNPIQIVMGEITSIQRNGNKLIVTLE